MVGMTRKQMRADRKRGGHAVRRLNARYTRIGKRRKVKATAKKNAKAISRIIKTFAPKFQLNTFNDVLVTDYSVPGTGYQAFTLNNLNAHVTPAADPDQYKYREADSMNARLRNIRLHFTMHANPGPEGGKLTKACVLLVKTTNNIGGVGGIQMPTLEEIWDVDSFAGLLAPWECFRNTQGVGAEVLQNTTILKKWSVWLEPQGGDCAMNFQTVIPALPGTAPSSTSAVAPGNNVNYTATRHAAHSFTHTQKTNNALCKFSSALSSNCTNVKYVLVLVAGDTIGHGAGWRFNGSIKINYYSE